ncbi:response regulator [Butyrivibrio sp. XPD2002]|uniref:response regulator n=1 Tax=Butyrivibrio sp. XPD2002 TaxID=1280665 RepID=UPI0004281998|nr:response regulator [Butyrivibrio sp. XPD2002]
MSDDYSKLIEEVQKKNKILEKALEEAEQANMAKTAFLSNMSHEIRTPMNAIIGLYNIALKNPDLPDETREILNKIGGSANHLLSLINDILDMSRIESGKVIVKKQDFSFGDMLEQINTMVESQCDDKGLEFVCHINGHVDDYYIGDDMKLKQALINILGNAVKFTEAPGTVSFLVEEIKRDKKNGHICFKIKDTGIGMDEDYLPKVFEPFSQEVEGASNKYGSTGLGMAITKKIVEMMNGTIEVESTKNVGTTFTVTVPLGISEKLGSGDEFDPGKIKTLILDDDVTACEHAQLVLGRIGIAADYCLSGKEALSIIEKSKARQEPYQLFLVDWKMPEMDGIQVTRALREDYKDESTTIILTTYNWDEILDEALKAGVDAFLAKPLFAGSIRKEIKEIIADKRKRYREAAKVSLKGRKVLIAEDMEINALIMKQILKMKEIEADHASDGLEAIKLFEESPVGGYDAILMDIRMPKCDGLKATERIRKLEREDAKSVPIIALSANAFDEDVELSIKAGLNAHLSKPVEPDALFSALQKYIK